MGQLFRPNGNFWRKKNYDDMVPLRIKRVCETNQRVPLIPIFSTEIYFQYTCLSCYITSYGIKVKQTRLTGVFLDTQF